MEKLQRREKRKRTRNVYLETFKAFKDCDIFPTSQHMHETESEISYGHGIGPFVEGFSRMSACV